MKALTSEYVKKYTRITIISDYKSHFASDIIYADIVETMNSYVKHRNVFSIVGSSNIFYTYDEFNDRSEYDEAIPRRFIFQNFLDKVDDDDVCVLRCGFYNTMDNSILSSVPNKIRHQSDLIIGIIDNTLTIVKDRYGPGELSKYNNFDLRNLGKSYKLSKILKRINS